MHRYLGTIRRSTWHGRLNLTPLVDIAFQLIVFFMLVSQFVSAERQPMQLPTPSDSQARPLALPDRLVVNLFADPSGRLGRIQLNAQIVGDLSELVDLLLRLAPDQTSRTTVVLRADRRLAFAEIEPVLKAISNASISSIEIATEMEAGGANGRGSP